MERRRRTFSVFATAYALSLILPCLANRSITTPTDWFWLTGVAPDAIIERIEKGFRIIDLELFSTSPYRLSAAFVRNSGVYQQQWWWYYNIDQATLNSRIASLNARLVDLEPYEINGELRFLALFTPNSGVNRKRWYYYFNASPSFIAKRLRKKRARPIDLDVYTFNGKTLYSVVMVRNSGKDATRFWWYHNVRFNFVRSRLRRNAARLVDLERNPNGRYTVIMQPANLRWYWYVDVTPDQLNDKAAQLGARIVDVETYVRKGRRLHSAVLLTNVNDLTRRVSDILSDVQANGAWGLHMKQVGGPVLASLQKDFVYEPASSIKSLHLAHTMAVVSRRGMRELRAKVPVFTNFDFSCPLDSGGPVTLSLQETLELMMQRSDNAATEAIRVRYGEDTLNQAAKMLGMTSSRLAHRIGCANVLPMYPDIILQQQQPNWLTLADITSLYERVATTFLRGPFRTEFFAIMNSWNAVFTIVNSEVKRESLPKKRANQFKSLVLAKQKDGYYEIDGLSYRSIGGYVRLPFRSCDGSITSRQYVAGAFIDKSTIDVSFGVIFVAGAETMRDEIKKAIRTFFPC